MGTHRVAVELAERHDCNVRGRQAAQSAVDKLRLRKSRMYWRGGGGAAELFVVNLLCRFLDRAWHTLPEAVTRIGPVSSRIYRD